MSFHESWMILQTMDGFVYQITELQENWMSSMIYERYYGPYKDSQTIDLVIEGKFRKLEFFETWKGWEYLRSVEWFTDRRKDRKSETSYFRIFLMFSIDHFTDHKRLYGSVWCL